MGVQVGIGRLVARIAGPLEVSLEPGSSLIVVVRVHPPQRGDGAGFPRRDLGLERQRGFERLQIWREPGLHVIEEEAEHRKGEAGRIDRRVDRATPPPGRAPDWPRQPYRTERADHGSCHEVSGRPRHRPVRLRAWAPPRQVEIPLDRAEEQQRFGALTAPRDPLASASEHVSRACQVARLHPGPALEDRPSGARHEIRVGREVLGAREQAGADVRRPPPVRPKPGRLERIREAGIGVRGRNRQVMGALLFVRNDRGQPAMHRSPDFGSRFALDDGCEERVGECHPPAVYEDDACRVGLRKTGGGHEGVVGCGRDQLLRRARQCRDDQQHRSAGRAESREPRPEQVVQSRWDRQVFPEGGHLGPGFQQGPRDLQRRHRVPAGGAFDACDDRTCETVAGARGKEPMERAEADRAEADRFAPRPASSVAVSSKNGASSPDRRVRSRAIRASPRRRMAKVNVRADGRSIQWASSMATSVGRSFARCRRTAVTATPRAPGSAASSGWRRRRAAPRAARCGGGSRSSTSFDSPPRRSRRATNEMACSAAAGAQTNTSNDRSARG